MGLIFTKTVRSVGACIDRCVCVCVNEKEYYLAHVHMYTYLCSTYKHSHTHTPSCVCVYTLCSFMLQSYLVSNTNSLNHISTHNLINTCTWLYTHPHKHAQISANTNRYTYKTPNIIPSHMK